jgi:hypothetical protein
MLNSWGCKVFGAENALLTSRPERRKTKSNSTARGRQVMTRNENLR